MQPMRPLDTRTPDQEYDYAERSGSGSSWVALVGIVLFLALLIGAVLVLGGDSGSESNEIPVPPTEAPLDPGA